LLGQNDHLTENIFFFYNLQLKLVLRMLSQRRNFRKSRFWQKSK